MSDGDESSDEGSWGSAAPDAAEPLPPLQQPQQQQRQQQPLDDGGWEESEEEDAPAGDAATAAGDGIEDCDGWDSEEEKEEEEEGDEAVGTAEQLQATKATLVQHAPLAAAAAGLTVLRREHPRPEGPRACAKGCGVDFVVRHRTEGCRQPVVSVACSACKQPRADAELRVGTVLWRRDGGGRCRYLLVTGLRRSALQFKRLSCALKLGGAEYPILGRNKFRVVEEQGPAPDLALQKLCEEWAEGSAGVWCAEPILFAVPPGEFSLACWEGAGAADGEQALAPGDWALWGPHAALPTGEELQEPADVQLQLVRVRTVRAVNIEDSEEIVAFDAGDGPQLVADFDVYAARPSVEGPTYLPRGQGSCSVKLLRRLGPDERDVRRRVPGARVGGSGGAAAAAVAAAAAAAGDPPAAAPTPATGNCGAAAAAAAAADAGQTPSGSDNQATSWSACSDASSGGTSPRGGAGAQPPPKRLRPSSSTPPGGQAAAGLRIEIADVYCGLGGLSLGLEQGCAEAGVAAHVRWGVDCSAAALAAFRSSHGPGVQVFSDARAFLVGVCEGGPGFPRKAALCLGSDVVCILVGGPPCQGFSGANQFGRPQDRALKNLNVFVFLGTLESLRWPFAVMENVVGLLRAGDTVPRILQWAASAGYQVRLSVLNAGAHGVAQHRRRCIFLFARADMPLPEVPWQSTLFPGAGGASGAAPATLAQRLARARAGVPRLYWGAVQMPGPAPLAALTAADVIGDLPHDAVPPSEPAAYRSAPTTAFQAAMRQGQGAGAAVLQHWTARCSDEVRSRIACVPKASASSTAGHVGHPQRPLRAGNWLDVPLELLPQSMAATREKMEGLRAAAAAGQAAAAAQLAALAAKWDGMYGRLQWGSHFATLLTSVQLFSDTTSTIIHPEADRPLTVRECARVQGIPDRVALAGTPEGYRAVGNAVPPPMTAALGRELGWALRARQQQQQQQQQQP